jgi:hypothetical protein
MTPKTHDKNGRSIIVGAHVRVLSIPSLDPDLDEDEVTRVHSMLGDVFEVYEVDAHGRAWVEKWWHIGSGSSTSHSLALEPNEMERVDG